MFEHLPIISQQALEAFGDAEVKEVIDNGEELLQELDKANAGLAKAIAISAQVGTDAVVDPNVYPELRETVEAENKITLLIILRLIDRALEAARLSKTFGA